MSVTNNAVSGKKKNSNNDPVQHVHYVHSRNIIIAHARMRTPTEELEYECLAWFHFSTLTSSFTHNVLRNHYQLNRKWP